VFNFELARLCSKGLLTSITLSLLSSLILFSIVPPAEAVEGADCEIAKTAIEQASAIRGLAVVRSVTCKLQSKEEVEAYLRQTIRERITSSRIENEALVYKLTGLIPWEFKYREGLISLYTDQLGGYYDPYREYYAMAQWLPSVMQMPVAVHELTHALQDQHFAIESILAPSGQTSDQLMARSALIEGDAMLVMLDHRFSQTSEPLLEQRDSVSTFIAEYLAGVSLQGAGTDSPRGLRTSLIFPYTSGLRFAHALLRDGGYKRIDQAYRELPNTTEQILHPEIYLEKSQNFQTFEMPESIPLVGERVYSDRLGEFLISTLLSTWLDAGEAAVASAGWNGDAIAIYRSKAGGRAAAQWRTAWDSIEDAREFFEAISKAYSLRIGELGVRTHSKVTFIDKYVGVIRISQEGNDVQIDFGF
jgi:hypothetical protein